MYQGKKELDVSEQRALRVVFADISTKVYEPNYVRAEFSNRKVSYSNESYKPIIEMIIFKGRLSSNGIYWSELKNLKEVLDKLLSAEEVTEQELGEANAILKQLKFYLQQ